MKTMTHNFEDYSITLDIPSCIDDCPYCHREAETMFCNKDPKNKVFFKLKDITDARRLKYPGWCPLETVHIEDKIGELCEVN